MIEKLLSKKFLATIIGALIIAVGNQLGFAHETLESIAGIVISFVAGQGIADFGGRGRVIVKALFSRKVWIAALGAVMVTAFDYLGIDPTISKWVLAFVGPYLLAEGVADAGKAFLPAAR